MASNAKNLAELLNNESTIAVADVVSLFKYSAKFFALLAIIRNTSPLSGNYLLV